MEANDPIASKKEVKSLMKAFQKAGLSETEVRRTFEQMLTEVFRGSSVR